MPLCRPAYTKRFCHADTRLGSVFQSKTHPDVVSCRASHRNHTKPEPVGKRIADADLRPLAARDKRLGEKKKVWLCLTLITVLHDSLN